MFIFINKCICLILIRFYYINDSMWYLSFSDLLHYRQVIEAAWTATNRGTDEDDVIQTHNGVFHACSVMFNSATPQTGPARLLCPGDFPTNSIRLGCHFLLQGISLTQGSNSHLLHCRWIVYLWTTREATMEYYSAIKNEIMPLAATWIDLDIIFRLIFLHIWWPDHWSNIA